MRLRWTAAGLAEAQKGFRRVKGHRYLPELTAAIRRELNPTPTEEAATARAWGTHPLRTAAEDLQRSGHPPGIGRVELGSGLLEAFEPGDHQLLVVQDWTTAS
jgi:hypothetical protein